MILIDLGSNTIRFLKYECKNKKTGVGFEKTVRTAEDLEYTNNIGKKAVDRIIRAINEAKNRINFNDKIFAVATAAFRKAKNANDVIAKINQQTKVEFKIISPKDEAKMTATAVFEATKRDIQNKDSIFVVDLGGASTEVSYIDDENFEFLSFDFGIVTMTNRFGNNKDKLLDFLKPIIQEIKDFKNKTTLRYGKAKFLTSCAGTPTTIAAMKHGLTFDTYNKKIINATKLYIKDIKEGYKKLNTLPINKRKKLVGTLRDDLIMVGIVIFEEIFKAFGYNYALVFDDGLREGLSIFGCKSNYT